MDETIQTFDTEKFMKLYSRLSDNKLEAEVARAFTEAVRREVQDGQSKADQIVNALTSRSKPPDFGAARNALRLLARASSTVVAHWQPFLAAVAEVLPPIEEGQVDATVDEATTSATVKDLRAALGAIGATLPVSSARELRELREGFGMLGDAIAVEFGKRGMEFQRDGSAALLGKLLAELDVANEVDKALPKDFAFMNRNVMRLRSLVDQHRLQIEDLVAQVGALKEDAVSSGADNSESEDRIKALEAEIEAMSKTRDEMGVTLDRLEGEKAQAVKSYEAAAHDSTEALKRVHDLEAQLARERGERERVQEEFEEFKKHHKKSKC